MTLASSVANVDLLEGDPVPDALRLKTEKEMAAPSRDYQPWVA